MLLALGGIALLVRFSSHSAPVEQPSQRSTTTLSGDRTDIIPGATVHEESVTVVHQPGLTHKTVFAATLDVSVQQAIQKNIDADIVRIKKDGANFNAWLDLGFQYKIAGDYNEAGAVWTYLTAIAPQSYIAFANLGDLYQNFLHDFPKAEVNYLQAVKLSPTTIDLYRNLYTLYRYQYKTNTTAAADILVRRLKNNPNNPDLLALQKQLPQ